MLHLLPTRTGGAAENMALDFLLLQAYPEPEAARFRHYDWRAPAVTFGYSQKWAKVEAQCEPDRDFCRRPTGGGIVDHTGDWTYCLVIPRKHPLGLQPAPLVYYLVHRTLCETLLAQNQDVILQPEESQNAPGQPGVCFVQAEPHDVILRSTGQKVAGAALKRNKNGLLIQGSIARAALTACDWSRFEEEFPASLAQCLSVETEPRAWPDLDPDQEMHLVDQFSTDEWNQRR